jgi:hypothetical protein
MILAGTLPPVSDETAMGWMVTVVNYGLVSRHNYRLAPAPITDSTVIPIGRIDVFVGFTGSTESLGSHDPSPTDGHPSTTLPTLPQ